MPHSRLDLGMIEVAFGVPLRLLLLLISLWQPYMTSRKPLKSKRHQCGMIMGVMVVVPIKATTAKIQEQGKGGPEYRLHVFDLCSSFLSSPLILLFSPTHTYHHHHPRKVYAIVYGRPELRSGIRCTSSGEGKRYRCRRIGYSVRHPALYFGSRLEIL